MRDPAGQCGPGQFRELFEEFLAGRVSLDLVLQTLTRVLGPEPGRASALQDVFDQALRSGRLPEQTWERLTTGIDTLISEDDPTDWSEDRAGNARAEPDTPTGHEPAPGQPEPAAPAAPELVPGSLIDDRYVVVSCEGTGGTGKVCKALDRKRKEAGDPNPWVAIKMLAPGLRSGTATARALRNEAAVLQSLSHPNIVQVFDFVQHGPMPFVSMEWLNGESLARLLERKRRQPMNREQADRIVSGIGQALAHAHGRRIVHGDVKPGNVIITTDGEARLLDFGFARLIDTANAADDAGAAPAHTRAWSSCEVLEGQRPTIQDDVFALALLSYRLLAGHPAFQGLDALRAESAGLVPAAVESLDEPRWQALKKALAFRREQRTPNVDSFLQQFFATAPATAEPDPVATRALPPVTSPVANPVDDAPGRPWKRPVRVAVAAGLTAIAVATYLNTPTPAPSDVVAVTDHPAPPDVSVDDAPRRKIAEPAEPQPREAQTAADLDAAAETPLNPAETAGEDTTDPRDNHRAVAEDKPAPPAPAAAGLFAPPPDTGAPPPVPAAGEPLATPAKTGPVLASTAPLAIDRTTVPPPAATVPFRSPEDVGPPVPQANLPARLPSEIGPAPPQGPRLVSLASLDFDHYVEPRFPRRLPAYVNEGWVLIQFDVNTQGRTTNVTVLDSEPAGRFDESATRAVSRWRFKPPMLNGENTEARSQVRLIFKRDN